MNDTELSRRVRDLIFFPADMQRTATDRIVELIKDEKALAYSTGFKDGQRSMRSKA